MSAPNKREGSDSSASGITAKAWDISTTYLMTGEKRPENGTPRVSHPLFGPDTRRAEEDAARSAWELAFRFTGIQAKEPQADFPNYYTLGLVPGFSDRARGIYGRRQLVSQLFGGEVRLQPWH